MANYRVMVDSDILYTRILQYLQAGVLALDLQGRVRAFNPAAERMLGINPEVAGQQPFAVALFDNPANDGFTQALLDAIYDAGSPHHCDVEYDCGSHKCCLNLTTSTLWSEPAEGEAPRKVGVVALFVDVTERRMAEAALRHAREHLERRVEERTRELAQVNDSLTCEIAERMRAQEQLAHLADHDALTGLANRRRFERCLTAAVAAGGEFALLYLDLDDFKSVNDTHGHDLGDRLLEQVSRRLEGCVRDGDTVARMGGDEFAVLLASARTADDVAVVVERIVEQVGQPYVFPDGLSASVGVSVGSVLHPQAGASPRDLLRASDNAMFVVKRSANARS